MKILICALLAVVLFTTQSSAQVQRPAGNPTVNAPTRFDFLFGTLDSAKMFRNVDTFPARYATLIFHTSKQYYYTEGNGTRWYKLVDTTGVSNRINLKLNISDTAAMLAPYARTSSTGTMTQLNTSFGILGGPITTTGTIKADTSHNNQGLMTWSDGTRRFDSLGILKVNYTDTSAMLNNYNAGVGYGLIKTAKSPYVDTNLIIPYTDTLKVNGIATKSDIRNSPSGTVTSVSALLPLSVTSPATTPSITIDTTNSIYGMTTLFQNSKKLNISDTAAMLSKLSLDRVLQNGNTSGRSISAGYFNATDVLDDGNLAGAYLINRTLTNSILANGHGFRDFTTFSRGGYAYNSFDVVTTFDHHNYNHASGYQFRPFLQMVDSTMDEVYGFAFAPRMESGQIRRMHGFTNNGEVHIGGNVRSQNFIEVKTMLNGDSSKRAIWVESDTSYFGGPIIANIPENGSSADSLVTQDPVSKRLRKIAPLMGSYLSLSDTLSMLNGRISSISLATPNVLYSTPTTFTRSSGAWSGTLSLNTQSAYQLFGTGSSTATPTFRFIDSNYFNGLWAAQVRNVSGSGNYINNQTGSTLAAQSAKFSITDTIQTAGNGIIGGTLAVTGTQTFTGNTRMNGNVGIGTAAGSTTSITVNQTLVSASGGQFGMTLATKPSTSATTFVGYLSNPQFTTNTLTSLTHFSANQSSLSGSTVTDQFGFAVQTNLTGATNNYGFYGNIAAGTNRWNAYMNGTAANYFNGNTYIGATTVHNGTPKLDVTGKGYFTDSVYFGTGVRAPSLPSAKKSKLVYYDNSDGQLYTSDTSTYLITASNGLTATAGAVALGGTLISNTTVTHNSNSMTFIQTKGMDNTGAQGINGTFSMNALTSADATQLNYAGVYGAIGNPSSAATTLNYKSIYAAVNGTSYAQNSGDFTGTSPYSGVSGWNLFANSGNLAMSAALHAKTPMKQSGQSASGIISTHSGLQIDSIRTATDLTTITKVRAINQVSSLDTNDILGYSNMGVINATGSVIIGGAVTMNGGFTSPQPVHVSSNSAGNSAGYRLDYLPSQANSRSWFLVNDFNAFGDFAIQQTTTQTGTTPQNALYFDASRNMTIPTLSGTGSRAVLADANGVLSAPVSDSSLKMNYKSLDSSLIKLMRLKPITYEFKPKYKNYGTGRIYGQLAQDVEKVFPELVFTTPQTGKKGIDYGTGQYEAILTKALQEANNKIDAQAKELALQADRLTKLEAIINKR